MGFHVLNGSLLLSLLWSLLCFYPATVLADYSCICANSIPTKVYIQPFEFSSVLGTLAVGDCKPTFPAGSSGQWHTIQYQGQVGFVLVTANTKLGICNGTVPVGDVVHTPSPLKIPSTTTRPILLPPIHGNIQLCPADVLRNSDPLRFYQHGKFCYEISNTAATWFDARDNCKNKTGILLTILNEDEQLFINKMMSTINVYQDVWLGLKSQPHTGFKWITGDPLNYTNWHDRLADSFHGFEDCIIFIGANHGKHGGWADVQCNGVPMFRAAPKYRWICKYNTSANSR